MLCLLLCLGFPSYFPPQMQAVQVAKPSLPLQVSLHFALESGGGQNPPTTSLSMAFCPFYVILTHSALRKSPKRCGTLLTSTFVVAKPYPTHG